jgi:hypothetical protein
MASDFSSIAMQPEWQPHAKPGPDPFRSPSDNNYEPRRHRDALTSIDTSSDLDSLAQRLSLEQWQDGILRAAKLLARS